MNSIKTILMSSIFILMFSGCDGQTSKKDMNSNKNKTDKNKTENVSIDTLNKPKIKVNVNKRYDDKGRIVQFDSTYSYSYTSPRGQMQSSNDSVFKDFRSFFDKNYSDFFNRQNNNIFFNDSLFKYDFFNEDYFSKRFQLNQKALEKMYQQMDSLKQNFLKHNYPQGYQKKNPITK
jgi:hypothetical protein